MFNLWRRSKALNRFKTACREIFYRLPPLPLTIYPRLIVDMGALEQGEVRRTIESEFQSLGLLLQRFEKRFHIRMAFAHQVEESPLVNAIASSYVTGDRVRSAHNVREDKIAVGDETTALVYGLAGLFENIRGHVAPRDDVAHDDGSLNRIGSSFLALQDDGQVVVSVGPNSLMDIKGTTQHLWAIDPAFWAVTHGTPRNIRDAFNTQYTARFHSPQLLRLLTETQMEWLLENPKEISKVKKAGSRALLQRRIIEEAFIPKLHKLYEKNRLLMESLLKGQLKEGAVFSPPQILDITERRDAAVPDIPGDIVAQRDNFGIIGFYVPKSQVDQICAPGESVYVTLETREYNYIDTKTARGTHLKIIPVTQLAQRTDAIFSGLKKILTLAPCIHSEAGDIAEQRVKLDLFVQMGSTDNPIDGFNSRGAAAALFAANDNRFVEVGHKVYAVVDRHLIDPIVAAIAKNPRVDLEQITPNWVIMELVERGEITYIDVSQLQETMADSEKRAKLIDDLTYTAPKQAPKVLVTAEVKEFRHG
jgi:hypothetical protein